MQELLYLHLKKNVHFFTDVDAQLNKEEKNEYKYKGFILLFIFSINIIILQKSNNGNRKKTIPA